MKQQHKNKVVIWAKNKAGYVVKVWVNRKRGTVLPTHWKIQSMMLCESMPMARIES